MSYDPSKAANYWGGERLAKARNPLAAVLSFSQPDFVNEAYDVWESAHLLKVLGHLQDVTIADVACGVGRMTVRLAQAGAHVQAIDIAAGMLVQTQEAALRAGVAQRVTLQMGMATQLPLVSQSCGGAICAGLMEHLPRESRQKCLSEIARILVPGGTLALVVNNAFSEYLKPAADNPHRTGTQYESGYFCELVSPEEMIDMARESGFEVSKVAANLQYSHLRHSLMKDPDLLPSGQEQMRKALLQDLENPLHLGEDERFADHFILACKLPPR